MLIKLSGYCSSGKHEEDAWLCSERDGGEFGTLEINLVSMLLLVVEKLWLASNLIFIGDIWSNQSLILNEGGTSGFASCPHACKSSIYALWSCW